MNFKCLKDHVAMRARNFRRNLVQLGTNFTYTVVYTVKSSRGGAKR